MAYFDCIVGGSSGDGSTLTVTCYSGFAGLTISITNGVDTFSDVCPSTSPYEVVFDGLANGVWTISTIYDGETWTETVIVNSTADFYPTPDGATVTPINDIQIWLHCANIWDKSYTTIGEVLADASVLLALTASNNAVDYMVRSTTWVSDVCADATAMSYIGANNYCADTLLSDNTWLNAICNSTYFESVLNVKVPTMTSETTPSGTVFASSVYDTRYFRAYQAFDGTNAGWLSANGNAVGAYIGYTFPTNVKLYKVRITNTVNNANEHITTSAHVQTLNGSYTTIKTISMPSTQLSVTNHIINGAPITNSIRLVAASVSPSSTGWAGYAEIQFYCRAAD